MDSATRVQRSPLLSPARIVRTYLLIAGLFTFSVSAIWGVNTLCSRRGFRPLRGLCRQRRLTVGTVLFEIPTGVVADTGRRRRSSLLSAAILLGGTLTYVAIAAVGGPFSSFAPPLA